MATKAKATSSSCISFLKDALLLPTRNAKLFVPVFLLLTISTFLLQTTDVFYLQPLGTGVLLRFNELENMDPSSPDYINLATEVLKEAGWKFVTILIPAMVTALVCGVANQVVALFASSSTHSGDRYSLPELFSKVILEGRRLRGPLITIAMVGVLDVACMLLLGGALPELVPRHLGALCAAALSLLPFLASLYLDAVFAVAVAVSVADTERRGVGALRQAWRLMTRVWRKEGCVLAVVLHLLGRALPPLYGVALRFSEKSMAMGLALLFVYTLLRGLVELFCFAATTVFYYQGMESKEVTAHDYVKIPTSEAAV